MTKLQERLREYHVPAFTGQMCFDKIAIWRLAPQGTTYKYASDGTMMTEGGLAVPDEARRSENRGILVSAGLKAMDVLNDNCIELGDIIWFGRFAGDEKTMLTSSAQFLLASVNDIVGSEDLLERLHNGRVVIGFSAETGQHNFKREDM